MGLFKGFAGCAVQYSNETTVSLLPESVLPQLLDATFGLMMLSALIVSTLANPTVFYLKIKEKTLTGGMFAALASVDFLANLTKLPTLYKLLSPGFEEDCFFTPSTSQTWITIITKILTVNQFLFTLFLSGTRFLKIVNPFQRIKKWWLVTLAMVFNLVVIPQELFLTEYASDNKVFVSYAQIVSAYNTSYFTGVRLSSNLIYVMTLLFSLAASVGAILMLQTAPSLTEQNKANFRRACRSIVAINILITVFLTIYLTMFIMYTSYVEETSKTVTRNFAMYSVVFFISACCLNLVSAVNPVLVLWFGYTVEDVREAGRRAVREIRARLQRHNDVAVGQ